MPKIDMEKKCTCGHLEWKRSGIIEISADSFTYYVGTNRTEGKGATHIEMSAVQSQENLYIIEAIRLNRGKNRHTIRTTLHIVTVVDSLKPKPEMLVLITRSRQYEQTRLKVL